MAITKNIPSRKIAPESITPESITPRKIALFTTGGTIAMQEYADGGVRLAGPSRISCPMVGMDDASITEFAFSNLPSPHITQELMLELSDKIDTVLLQDSFDAAVVLHGTDILPETAFVLELTLNTTKPVVITGSMRSQSDDDYDGPLNIRNACALCLEFFRKKKESLPFSAPLPVLATMAGEIFAAADVIKINSTALSSMGSSRGERLGRIEGMEGMEGIKEGRPVFEISKGNSAGFSSLTLKEFGAGQGAHPIFRAKKLLQQPLPLVLLVRAFTGMEWFLPDLFALVTARNVKGLVVEGFGAGNTAPELAGVLKDIMAENVPVLIASHCPFGGAKAIYSYSGGGLDLVSAGAICTGTAGATKALLFLQFALARGFTHQEIKSFFDKNFIF